MTLNAVVPRRVTAVTGRQLVADGRQIIKAAIAAGNFSIASRTVERLAKIGGKWPKPLVQRARSKPQAGSSPGAARRLVITPIEPMTGEEWDRQFKPPA